MERQRKTTTRPIRIYVPDRDLNTTVVRGVGFRVLDQDGRTLGKGRTWREAREDARQREG